MTSERECYVYIVPPEQTEFVTVGRFELNRTRDGDPLGRFVYGRSWLAREDAVPLDPVELRLREATYETTRMGGIFGAIRDSMPDSWGRRVIERNSNITLLDELDYLLKGPDDRAGALGFGLNVEPPAPRRQFNRTLDLERLQAAADALMQDNPELAGSAAAQVEELLLVGSGMGGARPKVVVEETDDLWIAKFSRPDDRWNHPRAEHGLLNLAGTCGLDVAESKLTTVAGRDVLLVRRFDRDRAKNRAYRRHRQVSALTLLQSEESDRSRWSYLLFADELRRSSANPTDDLMELFVRMSFNAIVSNIDDHPRNHAILAKDRDWRLSPAYDLTPTPQISRDSRNLAMACGTHGRTARRQNLLSGHGRFLLERDHAESIVDSMVNAVRSEWHATMRRAGLSEPDCERIASAFLYDGFFYDMQNS